MEIKSLLAQAANCKTQASAGKLLLILQKEFSNSESLCNLRLSNGEAYMEDTGEPFVRFDLSHVISDRYITTIRPEICGGELAVVVQTNHMLDAHGMSSKSWEAADGMEEDVIDCNPNQSIAKVAEMAKEMALSHHAELIERLGVPRAVAKDAAKKSWLVQFNDEDESVVERATQRG